MQEKASPPKHHGDHSGCENLQKIHEKSRHSQPSTSHVYGLFWIENHQHSADMPHSESGAPLVKRQKLSTVPASSAIATGSNIFAPFRVSSTALHSSLIAQLTFVDRWSGLAHRRPLHFHPPRQDDLPDHDVGRPLPADLRPEAWPQPRLRHTPADPARHYRDVRMEAQSVRCLGWQARR